MKTLNPMLNNQSHPDNQTYDLGNDELTQENKDSF